MHLTPLQMTSDPSVDIAVNRRAALATAAGLALTFSAPPAANAAGPVKAVMTLNTFEGVKGDVEFELYPDLAPLTVEAFTKYAKEGLYDGTAFHRVAKFGSKAVLQAGDPITRETKYCVEDESACTTNARGFCYEKKEGGGFTDKKVSCTAGNWYGPDGFISSATRSSKDDNGKKIRSEFGKGGPVGWRKDGLSKVLCNHHIHTPDVLCVPRVCSCACVCMHGSHLKPYAHIHIHTLGQITLLKVNSELMDGQTMHTRMCVRMSHTHAQTHTHTHTHTHTGEACT